MWWNKSYKSTLRKAFAQGKYTSMKYVSDIILLESTKLVAGHLICLWICLNLYMNK